MAARISSPCNLLTKKNKKTKKTQMPAEGVDCYCMLSAQSKGPHIPQGFTACLLVCCWVFCAMQVLLQWCGGHCCIAPATLGLSMSLLVLILSVWAACAGRTHAWAAEPPAYIDPDICAANVTSPQTNGGSISGFVSLYLSNFTRKYISTFSYQEDPATGYSAGYFYTGFPGVQADLFIADVTRPDGTDGSSDWVAGLCANGLPTLPSIQPSTNPFRFTFQDIGMPLPCSQQVPRYLAVAGRTVNFLVSCGNVLYSGDWDCCRT